MAPQKAAQNPVTWNGRVRPPAMTLVSHRQAIDHKGGQADVRM